jgi:hypothetical protein
MDVPLSRAHVLAGWRPSHTKLIPILLRRHKTLWTDWLQVKVVLTTDVQSASVSWCQAPIWGPRPDFYYCQTVEGLFIWGALSDKRMGLPFTIAAGLASAVILGSKSRGTHDILLSQIRDSSNLAGQVPVFISPRNRIEFPFCRVLRLVGLRCMYSYQPASTWGVTGFKVIVILRLLVYR